MTVKQIEKRQAAELAKFELAKQFRQMLDDAKKQHGEHWDEDFEETILELVSED